MFYDSRFMIVGQGKVSQVYCVWEFSWNQLVECRELGQNNLFVRLLLGKRS
jgi:hypothetical protein